VPESLAAIAFAASTIAAFFAVARVNLAAARRFRAAMHGTRRYSLSR
jgi:hypothetical protein